MSYRIGGPTHSDGMSGRGLWGETHELRLGPRAHQSLSEVLSTTRSGPSKYKYYGFFLPKFQAF